MTTELENKTYKRQDYLASKPTWCPGCGDFAVLTALTAAYEHFQLDPDQIGLVSGIGCSSRFPFFTKTYGFHSIHGRALPVAIGLKTVRPELTVTTVGGDGDGFSIGGNHFVHAARKNPNITYIVMDNEIYALTKGQNSPTSHMDLTTKINPYESVEERINPVLMALSCDTSFIARGFSGDLKQMKELIIQGMEHEGFSFIHILSPCVQYNHKVTYESLKERIRPLPENHDTTDKLSGMKLAFDPDYLYTGLFYKVNKPTFTEKLDSVQQKAIEKNGGNKATYEDLMKQFS